MEANKGKHLLNLFSVRVLHKLFYMHVYKDVYKRVVLSWKMMLL